LELHPFAIKLLASLIHGASAQQVQLIVSTQSSLLLDEFQPKDVIVVNHHGGESQFKRLDGDELASWLKDYTLGQLWEKNKLGGLP
jgi:predicted ATPase